MLSIEKFGGAAIFTFSSFLKGPDLFTQEYIIVHLKDVTYRDFVWIPDTSQKSTLGHSWL